MAQSPDYDAQSRGPVAATDYQHIFNALNDGLIIQDAETRRVIDANPAASALHGYAREEFIGLHPSTFMQPDSYAQFSDWVQAVRDGDPFAATADHLRRDGTSFTVEVRGAGCIIDDRLCLVSVIRDISARVQAERLLRQQVAARLREQSTLLAISQELATGLELNPDLILDQLRTLVDYTHAVLFALQELELIALAVRGPQRLEEAMPLRIRLEDPETLPALSNGHRPQRIADLSSDDPAAHVVRSLLNEQAPVLLEGVQAWMWVPLAVKDRVIGGIGIGHTEPGAFTTHQANLALTMANQAAITMVNAQLYEQAQTAAALEERQRLAQNLHDAVNQSLFSASLIAEVLPRVWERDVDEGRESLQALHRLIRGAMAEMRGLLAELRPMVLAETDLSDLLQQLGAALTGRSDIPVDVNVTGEGTLPADAQVTFYRVCQEALNNVAKHARASNVQIDLQYGADAVELRIRDDGQGFDPEQIPGHHGLSIMRERAKAIGATLSIIAEPGQGTEIVIRWTEQSE